MQPGYGIDVNQFIDTLGEELAIARSVELALVGLGRHRRHRGNSGREYSTGDYGGDGMTVTLDQLLALPARHGS